MSKANVIKMKELVRDNSDETMEHKTYRISISETEDKIVERFVTEGTYLYEYKSKFDEELSHKVGDTFKHYSTTTKQKFLCVNGPLQGTRVIEEIGGKQGYALFNNANSSYYQKKKDLPRVVLIHFV